MMDIARHGHFQRQMGLMVRDPHTTKALQEGLRSLIAIRARILQSSDNLREVYDSLSMRAKVQGGDTLRTFAEIDTDLSELITWLEHELSEREA